MTAAADAAWPMQMVCTVGLDELHRVVDREQAGDLATRRVDVQRDVLVRVLALEVEQLRHDQVGDVLVDRGAEQDDALLEELAQQAGGALAAVGGLLPDLGDVEGVVDHAWGSSWTGSGVGWVGFVGCVGSDRLQRRDRRRHSGRGASDRSDFRLESTTAACIDQELQRLASSDVRAYRLQHPPLAEIAPHPLGLFAHPLGQALDLGRPAPRRSPRSPPGRRPRAARGRRAPPWSIPRGSGR